MSTLLEQLKASVHRTGIQYRDQFGQKVPMVEDSIEKSNTEHPKAFTDEYRYTVTISARFRANSVDYTDEYRYTVTISARFRANSVDYPQMLEHAGHNLRDVLYGEVIDHLRHIQSAIHSGDRDTATALVAELRRRIG